MTRTLSSPRMVICEEDLQVIAAATLMRFPGHEDEAYRIERVRQFLNEAAELGRVLHVHTNCAMVNHRGSLGERDLCASTAELYAAFENYAALARVLAAEFRYLLFGETGETNDPIPAVMLERGSRALPVPHSLPS